MSELSSPGRGTLRRTLLDGLFYLLGSVLYALSVNVFTAPNQIAPGGVTGIATLVNYLTGLPIGTGILVVNLPLFAASWRFLGRSSTLRTAVVTVLSSIMIDATAPVCPALCGGQNPHRRVRRPAGRGRLGLIFMRGATTGGSEIVARLLERRFRHIPIGRLILMVDAAVVAAAAVVYRNLESALYAVILIFVSSSVMNRLIYGSDTGKMLLIMTRRDREVADAILKTLQRGVTILHAQGAYTGDQRQVLLVAVRPSQVYTLRTLVYDWDPGAFLIVVSTDEVLGEGFKPGGRGEIIFPGRENGLCSIQEKDKGPPVIGLPPNNDESGLGTGRFHHY